MTGPEVCLGAWEELGGKWSQILSSASLVARMVKNPPAKRETGVWSLGWEESPGGGHGNPLQYSCLENPMDRRAWQATVYGVARVRYSWATKHILSPASGYDSERGEIIFSVKFLMAGRRHLAAQGTHGEASKDVMPSWATLGDWDSSF